MGEYREDKVWTADIKRLRERVSALANSRGTPQYTTALRPQAADVPGLVILNTTTGKHEGSNGTVWTAFY